MTFFVIELRG